MSGPRFLLARIATLPFDSLEPLRARRAAALLREALDLESSLAARAAALCDALYRKAGPAPDRRGPDADGADGEGDAGDAGDARRRLDLLALRRDLHNARDVAEERIRALRKPLGEDLAADLGRHAAARRRHRDLLGRYRTCFEADSAVAAAALMDRARTPLFAEGLRLAGRALAGAVSGAAASGADGQGHAGRHAASKAAAYLGRFATKTSPNGIFSATCPVQVDERPGARARVQGEAAPLRVDLILNVAEARKIAACLAVAPEAAAAIAPRPNPTLRPSADGGWTWWRPATPRRDGDDETLCRAKDHPVLRAFLERAGRGLGAAALVEAVSRATGEAADDIARFLEKLRDQGILMAEVEIPWHSRRPLRDLAAACRAAGCAAAWLDEVESIEAGIDRAPAAGHAGRAALMDQVAERLERLPHARPLAPDQLFRLDAASPLEIALPGGLLDALRGPVGRYVRLFAAMYPERLHRAASAAAFLAKHPPDVDVELLDVYHGVFEPRPRTRPAAFPGPASLARGAADPGAVEAARRAEAFFAARARDARERGEREVRLEEADWEALTGGGPDPVWSAGVLFQVAARDTAAIDRGDRLLVLNALFSGAGLALARFAHLHGEPVVRELSGQWDGLLRALRPEPGAIVAEVTYMHGGRTANAGLRPPIFRHEIELPGEKASAGAEVIPLGDLTVRYDSARGRFALRSRSRGAAVIPVVNSGINPEGFVSFLVEIGRQGLQPVGWFPGFGTPDVGWWPRFRCGEVVLFRERWVFDAGGTPPARLAPADFFEQTARWRRRHDLPRHVFVHTAADPKPFYVDLESPPFVDLLRRALPASLTVTEMLPGPGDLWVAGGGGRHAAEFLAHLQGGASATMGTP